MKRGQRRQIFVESGKRCESESDNRSGTIPQKRISLFYKLEPSEAKVLLDIRTGYSH